MPVPRLLRLMLVATIVVGGAGATPAHAVPSAAGTVAQAAPAAPLATTGRGTSLGLRGATTVLQGHGTWLTGTWTKGGAPKTGAVRLEKLVRGQWKTVRRERVVRGSVRIYVKPSTTTTYRIARGARTAAATVTVENYYVTITDPAPRTVTQGRSTTVSVVYRKHGKLPATGALRLQKKVAGGTWRTAKTVRVTDGVAQVRLKPSSRTAYRLATTNGRRVSQAVTVTVTPPTEPPAPAPPSSPPEVPAPPAALPTSFRVSGSGYGHGVGMSQYGAYQMAREGKSAAEILQHYYTGSSVVTRNVASTIRVQVFGAGSDSATSTTFSVASGTWELKDSEGRSFSTPVSAGQGDTVRLAVTSGKVTATINGTKYSDRVVTRADGFRLVWSDDAVARLSTRSGATYKFGFLRVTAADSRPNVVNHLSMTQYLYGLGEMPSSWGAAGGSAALQAQAIAARGYANGLVGTLSSCDCDVYDDVRHQNFTGWAKAGESRSSGDQYYGKIWQAAVDATETNGTKVVVSSAGATFQPYYYSSSGGRTANSEDVWSSKLSHLRSVADSYSLRAPGNSMTSWTRTLTQARAQQLFGLDSVVSIAVTATYSSGQMKTLTATSATGATTTLTAKADVLRSRLGLPAAWVSSLTPIR